MSQILNYNKLTISYQYYQRPLETVMDETEAAIVPHIMSEQEIMHKYWKISMNVRLASVALQR